MIYEMMTDIGLSYDVLCPILMRPGDWVTAGWSTREVSGVVTREVSPFMGSPTIQFISSCAGSRIHYEYGTIYQYSPAFRSIGYSVRGVERVWLLRRQTVAELNIAEFLREQYNQQFFERVEAGL